MFVECAALFKCRQHLLWPKFMPVDVGACCLADLGVAFSRVSTQELPLLFKCRQHILWLACLPAGVGAFRLGCCLFNSWPDWDFGLVGCCGE